MELQRSLNVGYGLSRVAFGLVAVAAPRQLGRTWIGDDVDSPGATVLCRALGARDIALGAGTVVGSLQGEADLWLASSVIADLGDVAGTISASKDLPTKGVRTTSALAGAAAIAGAALIALNRSAK